METKAITPHQDYYFYAFKYNMHCICKSNGIEYLGVKGTADTKEEAMNIISQLNSTQP